MRSHPHPVASADKRLNVGTAMSRGKYLARVCPTVWIDRAPQAVLGVGVVGCEQHRHVCLLFYPDTVLARENTTCGERGLDDLGARGVDPVEYACLTRIEDQQRMQIAVAGVEHVHHN